MDSIFKKNFGNSFFTLDGQHANTIILDQEAIDFILEHRSLSVLSSHQLLYPLPTHPDLTIYSIFFLRHPIDCVGSVYHFEKRQNAKTPGAIMAKQLDFKEYVLWRLQGESGGIKNFHVRRLSFGGNLEEWRNKQVITQELSRAKENLVNSGFFGIVERFDDSLLYMKDYLQRDFPKTNYSYAVQNENVHRGKNLEDRLSIIAELLGEEIYEKLLKMNEYDLEFYEFALKLFESRFNKFKQS